MLDDVIRGKYLMCVSSGIMDEYRNVLFRSELGIKKDNAEWILSWIRLNALWIEPLPSKTDRPKMQDEDDRVFYDVAKCLNAKLITRNYKDYPIHELITLIDELY